MSMIALYAAFACRPKHSIQDLLLFYSQNGLFGSMALYEVYFAGGNDK